MTPLDITGIPDKPVSRIAPTPSGYLHVGNAVNFLITWALVRGRGGSLHLRIDDMDGIRFRDDVLGDIFESLEWLGVDWDTGPSGPDEFHTHFSLQKRRDFYRSELDRLSQETGKLFACGCSRSAIKKTAPNGLYPGTCRHGNHALTPYETAMRVQVEAGAVVDVGGHRLNVAETFGDFVLWRKDDQPAYQFASLLEDECGQVNFITRGEDLLPSTAAQLYLADLFDAQGFRRCSFLHHGLILGEGGEKLSKSRGSYALKDMRDSGDTPDRVWKTAARFLGLNPEAVTASRDLIQTA
ncbi:glutamate--tRNA ligase family protein [Desulfoluna limicola]|uniref:glutamate--tRNA ligase family protein n=1 Tax=Desulfoluna limicola TaxID=2810562 RepID=UPI001EFF9433|nr:glutamate--tRNA ligase family protein [Desulfoluna limicola]